jgi:hypothetical protein
MDQRNPVNSMPFFPAEQDWTIMSQPNRILLEECFPASYKVNSLPALGNRNTVQEEAKPCGETPTK